jgi:hypothetical protein
VTGHWLDRTDQGKERTTTTETKYTAFELARMADVASPESKISLGSRWLLGVAEAAVEALGRLSDEDTNDVASEVADSIVPVYTHELWTVFVDLAAYQEDVSELGYEWSSDDHDKLPRTALYMIAERLTLAIFEEKSEEDSEEE